MHGFFSQNLNPTKHGHPTLLFPTGFPGLGGARSERPALLACSRPPSRRWEPPLPGAVPGHQRPWPGTALRAGRGERRALGGESAQPGPRDARARRLSAGRGSPHGGPAGRRGPGRGRARPAGWRPPARPPARVSGAEGGP